MVTGISMALEKLKLKKKIKQKSTSAFYPEKQPAGSCPGIFYTRLRVFWTCFFKTSRTCPQGVISKEH